MEFGITLNSKLEKQESYTSLLPQLEALVGGESNLISNLANIAAVLKYNYYFHWVGFYLKEDEGLVLGPFQGPMACTRISKGKGVCGFAVDNKKSIIVPNVDEFEAHISCSSETKSEIVVPVIKNNEVIMVIDVDSAELNTFDKIDQDFLESLAKIIAEL
jgi:GAF domain-containing protein